MPLAAARFSTPLPNSNLSNGGQTPTSPDTRPLVRARFSAPLPNSNLSNGKPGHRPCALLPWPFSPAEVSFDSFEPRLARSSVVESAGRRRGSRPADRISSRRSLSAISIDADPTASRPTDVPRSERAIARPRPTGGHSAGKADKSRSQTDDVITEAGKRETAHPACTFFSAPAKLKCVQWRSSADKSRHSADLSADKHRQVPTPGRFVVHVFQRPCQTQMCPMADRCRQVPTLGRLVVHVFQRPCQTQTCPMAVIGRQVPTSGRLVVHVSQRPAKLEPVQWRWFMRGERWTVASTHFTHQTGGRVRVGDRRCAVAARGTATPCCRSATSRASPRAPAP